MDQLATGWWIQMHNSTDGTVDWFIENKVEGKRRRSGGAGSCGKQADEQEDVARSVAGREKTVFLGV